MFKKLLIVYLLFLSKALFAQEIRFRHIAEQEGLKYTWVWDIFKDSEGFMWFSTQEGAFKYNGIEFEHFTTTEDGGLSSDRVNFVFEDSKGNIWFGTDNGLDGYNRQLKTFKTYQQGSKDGVLCMEEDKNGNLWVGTTSGLNIYNSEVNIFTEFSTETFSCTPTPGFVSEILVDSKGGIWFGGSGGTVNYAKSDRHCFKKVTIHPDQEAKINVIFEDTRGFIWIGLNGHGLVKFNPFSKKIEKHYTAKSQGGISSSYVRAIVEDNYGRLWIGTEKGISILDLNTSNFSSVNTGTDKYYGLSDNAIYSMFKENNGDIWIGTFFGGINVWHNRYTQFKCYIPDGTTKTPSGKAVSDIFCGTNKIWIGSEDNGLSVLNTKTGLFKHYTRENSNLSYNNVHAALKDSRGNLWIGTYTGGLNRLKSETENFTTYYSDRNAQSRSSVYSIYEDSDRNLWIGTRESGLYIFDYNSDQLIPVSPEKLGKEFIWDILEDTSGNIWIAAYGKGIYKLTKDVSYNPTLIDLPVKKVINLYQSADSKIWVGTEKEGLLLLNERGELLNHLTKKDGLPDNTIYDVIQDDQRKLWFTTNYGLCKTTDSLKQFKVYTVSDGLPTNRFNYNSSAKHNGKLYFGSTRGLIIVDPDFNYREKESISLYLSSFSLFNKEVEVNTSTSDLLEKQINYTANLVLSHNNNSFSIEYSALTYWNSDKINYAYKLKGLDTEWNFVGNKRKASYTNLDPGEYTFQVRTVDDMNNLMDNERYLTITILYPWYNTWWAYATFIIVVLSIATLIVSSIVYRTKAEHALEIEKLEKRKSREISELKINFFTNISHEFKNPLSLISGPINQLIELKNISENRQTWYYNLIKKNTDRLLLLINELLEFKYVQDEHLMLKLEKINPTEIIKEMTGNFMWLAETKNINFSFQPDDIETELYVDAIKFEKIISNILSNAFKYTPENGYVIIETCFDQEYFKVNFKNSGKGIRKENLNKVFDRYYTEENEESSSSGIGLAYVKILVDLHHGNINALSLPGLETCFVLEIPLHLNNPTQIQNRSESNPNVMIHPPECHYTIEDLKKHYPQEKPKIIIVDDVKEMRDFIQDSLSSYFLTFTSSTGTDAFQMAQTEHPDIIVSDVIMPKMNGFELCQKIKNNLITSHIRVILLTALSESNQKISGYKSGADAYISKPFDVELLKSRIINLLINSKIQKNDFQKNIDLSLNDIAYSDPDEKLLKLAIDTVNKYIDDPEFNLDKFATETGVSKTTLYRKLKAITGQSANEFILTIRLKYAAKLIKTTSKRISEISYEVGFSDPYYFSRAFKKCFKVSPKEYREPKSANVS